MNPNATITDEQFKAYLKKVRDMVEGPYTEWQKEIEVTNTFPEKFYQSNIDNDIYRYSLPVEYGGWGLSEKEILQVQEEFSRGPSGMRMHMHYASDLNWRILNDFGQPEIKEKYMPLFQDKTIFTNFALTEKSGGTGADLHSTAVWDEEKGKWILNGEKWLISHTDCSQFSYVICVTDPDKKGDDRLSAFFVPMDRPGFEIVPMPHMMGCRGSGHTGLKFTNVELEPELMLGKRGEGMKVAMHSLAVSRVHIATSNLGISQRMFEMSIARARDRVTFGKPIIKRQAIRVKLANMQMMINALRCTIIDFCDDFDLTTTASTYPRRLQSASCSPSTPFVSFPTRCSRSSVATVTSRILLMVLPNSFIATAALCGLRKALLPYSASPSLRASRNMTVLSSTRPGSLALSSTSSDSFNQELSWLDSGKRGSFCFPFFCKCMPRYPSSIDASNIPVFHKSLDCDNAKSRWLVI